MDGMGGKTRMITMSTEGVTNVVGNYFEIKGAKTQCIVSENRVFQKGPFWDFEFFMTQRLRFFKIFFTKTT